MVADGVYVIINGPKREFLNASSDPSQVNIKDYKYRHGQLGLLDAKTVELVQGLWLYEHPKPVDVLNKTGIRHLKFKHNYNDIPIVVYDPVDGNDFRILLMRRTEISALWSVKEDKVVAQVHKYHKNERTIPLFDIRKHFQKTRRL